MYHCLESNILLVIICFKNPYFIKYLCIYFILLEYVLFMFKLD
jgi:hypothetical protein